MSKPVIEVSGLSKKYIISHQQKAQYGSLRDNIASFAKKPFEKNGQKFGDHEKNEEFWALKDVSFEVNKGEIFGIVGRNGSGKSTLLKTLSRIISPTKGTATIHGRTASLLEVGTGFHPELTGRENVFFNGSMLGMSRNEIGRKFDEIVQFAEIEKFLDTPVKFYSSGMYVRLAFSVAAHLEPDVLILDEVLAVGDGAFQEKSMKKILSTIESGTTVLFVSHGMDSIKKICSKGLLLQSGKVAYSGNTSKLVELYTAYNVEDSEKKSYKPSWNEGVSNEYFDVTSMYLTDKNNHRISKTSSSSSELWVNIDVDIKKYSPELVLGYAIESEGRSLLYTTYNKDATGLKNQTPINGKVTLRGSIPPYLLNEGVYKIKLIASIFNKQWIYDFSDTQAPFIHAQIKGGLSHDTLWSDARDGLLAPQVIWETTQQ